MNRETGIVIHSIRYTDSARVVRILTKNHGLKTFMIRLGKNKNEIVSLLHAFSLVEFTCHFREQTQLHSLQSISRSVVLTSIPFDLEKSSIAIFLDEVLEKTLADDYSNQKLYEFIEAFVLALDHTTDCRNYHLWFMIHLSGFYGFSPQASDSNEKYFDLQSGCFSNAEPVHPHFIHGKIAELWNQLIDSKPDELKFLVMSSAERSTLLETLITYFRLHLEGLREIKSHKVLEEVFDEAR